ncbi:MAG: RNA-binding protein, partial [Deltaproteobacteria bacterium]|nr:RNA-binding protein [Deltaproteobacteria bacterium]
MGKKLFVGGLSWNTEDASLRSAFERFGVVADAKVIKDRESNRSRGFGFVTMGDDESARKAVEGMDGKELDGRTVKVSEAQERPPRSGGYGDRGGGGGGGGYGG